MFILAEYEKQIIMWGQNFHNYLFSFLINFSNHFGWITYSNGIVGNVFSYDTSSSDNTAMTYFYSGTKNSSSSYPAIFSDSYGICILFGFASGYVIYRMMWSIDLYIGPINVCAPMVIYPPSKNVQLAFTKTCSPKRMPCP